MSTQELRTLYGYIRDFPQAVSKEELVKVALVVSDGTEYGIVHKGSGIALLQHVNANIEVVGVVEKHEDVLCLLVRSFTLIDDFEDEWYDDTVG